jgi:hypothetical protein
VTYYLMVHYLVKNSLQNVAMTGIVTSDIATLISGGGGGPTIKPTSVVTAEASLMQASVNSARAPGYVTQPQALLSSGDSTGAGVAVSSVPSGTPANVSSMMSSSSNKGGVPVAFTPDEVQDLAVAPI